MMNLNNKIVYKTEDMVKIIWCIENNLIIMEFYLQDSGKDFLVSVEVNESYHHYVKGDYTSTDIIILRSIISTFKEALLMPELTNKVILAELTQPDRTSRLTKRLGFRPTVGYQEPFDYYYLNNFT